MGLPDGTPQRRTCHVDPHEARHRLLGRDDVAPGMIAAIRTHGELLHGHPHFHVLLTCGAFTRQGEFLELPELDMERLEAAWQVATTTRCGKKQSSPCIWPPSGDDASGAAPSGCSKT